MASEKIPRGSMLGLAKLFSREGKMKIRDLIVCLLSVVPVGCTTFYGPPGSPAEVVSSPEARMKAAIGAWDKVLVNHVDAQGRVNFVAVAKQPGDLHQFVQFIASVSPETHPDLFADAQRRLAFYLDSYNALAMYGVIQRGIPDGFTSFFSRAGFFKFTEYQIGGKAVSLYDYENNLIRKLGDPRVHFTLNCMSVGCPRLPQYAFLTVDLEKELDRSAKEFFSSEKYLQVDASKKVVRVSEILKFFTEDFVNPRVAPSLISYINRYAPKPIPEDYDVEFIPYDWRINKQ
jgi:hypothetical protein